MLHIASTMDDDSDIKCYGSEDSVIEIEMPKKPSPPVILIEDEEIILNVMENKRETLLAKDVIKGNRVHEGTNESKIRTSTNVNSPSHWTADMIKFYDDDWGDEDQFVVEKLQEKMDKSPFLWDISKKDILFMKNKLKRSNIKCWNCKQRGHHFSMCPDPPHVPKCFMCGVQGHLDYCCPNSKCLNCGNSSDEYVIYCYKCRNCVNEVCSRCQLIGHNFLNCSDHWRLFHLTTNTRSVKIPDKNIYKSDKEMWCCNCGRKGHYQTQCLQKKEANGFRDTVPFVVSYQESFNDNYPLENTTWNPWMKNKSRRKEMSKSEKNLRLINPLHRAIRKDKSLKNRLKRRRKYRNKRKEINR